MSVGENIKKYRNKKGFTQPKLGKIINKSESSIRKYESNDVIPSIEILKEIAKALEVDLTLLLGNDIKEATTNFTLISRNKSIEQEITTLKHIREIIKICDDLGYENCFKFYSLLTINEQLSLSHDLRKFISQQIKTYLYANGKYKTLSYNDQTHFGLLDDKTIALIEDEIKQSESTISIKNNDETK